MKLLAHLLVSDYGLDMKAVEQAMHDVVIYGGSLGTNLLELKLIDEDTLLSALSRRYGTPAFDIRHLEISNDALEAISPQLIRKHKVLPLRMRGKTLELLMVNPLDRVAMAEIGMACGAIVKPYVVVEARLEELLEQYAGVARGWRYRENPLDRSLVKRRPITPSTFLEAKALLNAASHRDDVGDTLLGFLLRHFARVVVFVNRRDLLIGWRGAMRSPKGVDKPLSELMLEQAAMQVLYLPLNHPSVFRTVVESGSPYIGALAANRTHEFFLSVFGGGTPMSAFVAPVSVAGRVVNVVYGDNGTTLPVTSQLADVVLSLAAAADTYDRLIRERLKKEISAS